MFRPATRRFYLRYTNTQGSADEEVAFGEASWMPIAGELGLGRKAERRADRR